MSNMWKDGSSTRLPPAKSLYPVKGCPCKRTGLIPPTKDLKPEEHQVYCPTHRIKRDWLQLQADGSTKRILLP
jgi:hypothetical protein